ncbi:MAG: helix-turn-helix transcriptional regulator [Planctomycetota bacterium]
MLHRTLQQLVDRKLTTAKEMGELAGVSTSTVYRWIAGQSQPDFDAVRLLVRLLPNPAAQEALLRVVTAGTDWKLDRMDLDLDLNGDGRIDAADALDASIAAVKHAADSLAQVRAKCCDETSPATAEDTLELITQLGDVMTNCTIAQRVLLDMADQRRKRKLKLAN